MARVVAFVPDLLFGSNVAAAIQAAGHESVLVPTGEALRAQAPGADLLIVDLTSDAPERIAQVVALRRRGLRMLAFYSHVEASVRAEAEQSGIDLVVPRSRMAREGAALVERMLGPA